MRNYSVALPITGVIYVNVQAESADEAIDLALESDDIQEAFKNIDTWETHRAVCRGNVFYGVQMEADATDEGEVEEGDES